MRIGVADNGRSVSVIIFCRVYCFGISDLKSGTEHLAT